MSDWQSIETPPDGDGAVVLYHPGMDRDQDFPGLPVTASNPEYVRAGNAKRQGYTHWCRIPPLPS